MPAPTRAKISAAKTGYKHTDDAKANIAAANRLRVKLALVHKGHKHTAESKAKISAANKGRKHTAQARANMSTAFASATYLACHPLFPSWSFGRDANSHGANLASLAPVTLQDHGRHENEGGMLSLLLRRRGHAPGHEVAGLANRLASPP